MSEIQAAYTLLLYVGENIALFCGGLFAGATLYICMTERPPRTALGFADLLALSRANARRTNALLGTLAGLTGTSALVSAFVGGGAYWLAGGLAHLVALALLLSEIPRLARQLDELGGDREHEAEGLRLLNRQTAYLSVLCLIGLIAQYLFIARQ